MMAAPCYPLRGARSLRGIPYSGVSDPRSAATAFGQHRGDYTTECRVHGRRHPAGRPAVARFDAEDHHSLRQGPELPGKLQHGRQAEVVTADAPGAHPALPSARSSVCSAPAALPGWPHRRPPDGKSPPASPGHPVDSPRGGRYGLPVSRTARHARRQPVGHQPAGPVVAVGLPEPRPPAWSRCPVQGHPQKMRGAADARIVAAHQTFARLAAVSASLRSADLATNARRSSSIGADSATWAERSRPAPPAPSSSIRSGDTTARAALRWRRSPSPGRVPIRRPAAAAPAGSPRAPPGLPRRRESLRARGRRWP